MNFERIESSETSIIQDENSNLNNKEYQKADFNDFPCGRISRESGLRAIATLFAHLTLFIYFNLQLKKIRPEFKKPKSCLISFLKLASFCYLVVEAICVLELIHFYRGKKLIHFSNYINSFINILFYSFCFFQFSRNSLDYLENVTFIQFAWALLFMLIHAKKMEEWKFWNYGTPMSIFRELTKFMLVLNIENEQDEDNSIFTSFILPIQIMFFFILVFGFSFLMIKQYTVSDKKGK